MSARLISPEHKQTERAEFSYKTFSVKNGSQLQDAELKCAIRLCLVDDLSCSLRDNTYCASLRDTSGYDFTLTGEK